MADISTTATFSGTPTFATLSPSIPLITDPAKIALYNRGPILTTFVPPASCLSTLTTAPLTMYFGHETDYWLDTRCYPPSATPYAGTDNAWNLYYYSPGVGCPSGWAHAATLSSSFGLSGNPTQLEIGVSTTVVVCCPSGFIYTGNGHGCGSQFSGTTSKLLYIEPSLSNNVWVSTDANTHFTTMASADPYIVYGDGIAIWWQQSDLEVFALAATMTSGPSNTDTSASTSPTQTASSSFSQATQSENTTPSTSTLSTGAKIAIAVIIPLFIIASAAGFAIYCIRNRKVQRKRTGSSSPMMQMDNGIKMPEHQRELGTDGAVSELYVGHGDGGGNKANELPG